MKKASSRRDDDLRPEYDFTKLKGGVRGKYYRRFQAGTNIVRLEPSLARAFPTDEAVNEALRTVMRASRALKAVRLPNKQASIHSRGRVRVRRRSDG
jgi:hypothetical protein